MNFQQAIQSGFKNYANFSGRAPRSEYWYWSLFVFIGSIIFTVLDRVIFGAPASPDQMQPLGVIFSLGTLLPGISQSIRRLHDIDRKGWWLLIAFTGIGIFLLIYWACKRGTMGDNRFGPDPLSGKSQLPPNLPLA